jgi:hypothetical protein
MAHRLPGEAPGDAEFAAHLRIEGVPVDIDAPSDSLLKPIPVGPDVIGPFRMLDWCPWPEPSNEYFSMT